MLDLKMNRLFKNLIGGMGSILAIMPTDTDFIVGREYLKRSNWEAINKDWLAVGDDIRSAVKVEGARITATVGKRRE